MYQWGRYGSEKEGVGIVDVIPLNELIRTSDSEVIVKKKHSSKSAALKVMLQAFVGWEQQSLRL